MVIHTPVITQVPVVAELIREKKGFLDHFFRKRKRKITGM